VNVGRGVKRKYAQPNHVYYRLTPTTPTPSLNSPHRSNSKSKVKVKLKTESVSGDEGEPVSVLVPTPTPPLPVTLSEEESPKASRRSWEFKFPTFPSVELPGTGDSDLESELEVVESRKGTKNHRRLKRVGAAHFHIPRRT